MTCDTAQLLIEDELDGTLGAEQAQALRAHLRECTACVRVREDLRRIETALSGPEDCPVADVVRNAMVDKAVSRAGAGPGGVSVRTVVVLATAASLVLVCWLGWLRTHRSGPSPGQPSVTAGPVRGSLQTPRVPPPVASAPSVSRGNHTAPPRRPPHSGRPRLAQRRYSPNRPTVVPPGPSPPPPADQLTPADVCRIYETALAFARDGRPTGGPLDLVSTARVRADSGDLPGAIEAYEAAVEASVRSPASTWVAQTPPDADSPVVQNPSPPADVLVAWLAGGG